MASKVAKGYKKPELKKFGSVKDVTLTTCTGGMMDGGSTPKNKKTCVSLPTEIAEHRDLLAESRQQMGFKKEIERVVNPDSVVLDLGCGTGIHTLFACRAGAKKVYAVESESIIQIAKNVIAANGYSDRVEFVHADSRTVQLPEKVDVLVSNVGFFYSMKCLPHAARAFLKPNGHMIPRLAQFHFVPYSDAAFYRQNVKFWDQPKYGFDFSSAKSMASHHPHYRVMNPKNFLAQPLTVAPIEFAKADRERFHCEFEMKFARPGVVHALGGWYDFHASGKEAFLSNKPPFRSNIWTNFLLPLEEPLKVKRGDKAQVTLSLDMITLTQSSLWTWKIELNNRLHCDQSSFRALLLPQRPS